PCSTRTLPGGTEIWSDAFAIFWMSLREHAAKSGIDAKLSRYPFALAMAAHSSHRLERERLVDRSHSGNEGETFLPYGSARGRVGGAVARRGGAPESTARRGSPAASADRCRVTATA